MKKFENTSFLFEEKITKEQTAFFNKYGIIHFKNFINNATVKELIVEVEKVQSHLLENAIIKVNGIPLKFGTDINKKPLIQRIAFASHYSQRLSAFLKDERFTAIVKLLEPYEGRVGENEKDGLVVNHYINTPHSKFNKLGWHTDSPRDLFLGTKILPMLNVGLHLDDCSSSNGGLRVLLGTHKQNIFGLLFRKKYFIDNRPDKKEVGLDIEAGDLTIHNGSLWHRVQQSPHVGEQSRRRVMYIPIITGAYKPKHVDSATPFYHKLGQINLNSIYNKLKFPGLAKNLSR